VKDEEEEMVLVDQEMMEARGGVKGEDGVKEEVKEKVEDIAPKRETRRRSARR
jgi:hypothetical protein